ncbi:M56 family metallopeptidase [Flavilitoribacter nigricans]|uniref:Peptidase M56 domain-containing protein n=1 Tax=Flavilitoribacter nigricans (strain ATCC 23147 / DSM 23189 / NBRC 102662 / NCIMB 1420 / SS-2) TaxID=1122177 RepID=A0A2D0NHI8_FLAN2|nr:M56 family metallopeptidase [Flavilitoribacter nigricans]PHN07639.1 hypothetical protein CRP01_05945 [Flavilitoribacter nigricans DSM 23189 = NBRC 102662]
MMEALQNNPLVLALGWMLVHALWQAALIALVVRGLWLFVSRRSANWRYGLALAGMLLILLAAVSTFSYYTDRYAPMEHVAPPPHTISISSPEAVTNKLPLPEPALTETVLSPDISTGDLSESAFSLDHYLPYLVLLWGMGAIFMGLRLAGSWWYMHRVSRRGLVPLDAFWGQRFNHMLQRMGIRRPVRIYFSRLVEEPLTFGHLRPLILFPLALVNQLSVEQVEAILLHELAHIRRWDYLVNWLQSILELLFFFHPAVWWLSGEVRKAREHCCDDLVLRRGKTSRKLYAQTLTQLAALSFKPKPKLVMSIKGIKDAFSQRVFRLYGQDQAVLDWRKPVLSLALGCMLLPFLWLIQPERFGSDNDLDRLSALPVLLGGESAASAETASITLPPETYPNVPDGMDDLYLVDGSEVEIEPADAPFYELLQLNGLARSQGEDIGITPTIPFLPVGNRYREMNSGTAFVQPNLVERSVLFVVDGQEISLDAPYRQIAREDIERLTFSPPPMLKPDQKVPQDRRGKITIKTKAGNWPGGRPYWPAEIRQYEVNHGDHLETLLPMGRASGWDELGKRKGLSLLNGIAWRKVNYDGQQTYSIFNGHVLRDGEVVETNQHALFGGSGIPIIGLYNGNQRLIYGEPTPREVADRTYQLNFKDGYSAVVGKYPCDNKVYIRAYYTLQEVGLPNNLNYQLMEGVKEAQVRDIFENCDQLDPVTGRVEIEPADGAPFIIDGREISREEAVVQLDPKEVTSKAFLTPDLKPASMVTESGLIRIRTKSGNWSGGRPYWPYEVRGWRINKSGQAIYMSLNGRYLKNFEVETVNNYEIVSMQSVSVIGLYDREKQLVLGSATPAEKELESYELKLQDGYTAVLSKYPCDAQFFLTFVFTLDGLKARGDIWTQTDAGMQGISMEMMQEHCMLQEDRATGQNAHRPVVPEPLFVIDGKFIDPAEPYREISNDQLKTESFMQPAEAIAHYGQKGRNGVVVLSSKAGGGEWAGGKPYAPLHKLLGKGEETEEIVNFAGTQYYFIDGQAVRSVDFNLYNVYSFPYGTISHPKVAAIHGLDGTPADLQAIRRTVGQEGIAYELRPGLVVVEYLETCRNTIPMVAALSALTNKEVIGERNRLREEISWRENELKCAEISPEKLKELPTKNMAFLLLQKEILNSLKIYPTPFEDEVKIVFDLPETLETKVSIISPEGTQIAELVNKKLEAGTQQFLWISRDQSVGNYWVQIEAGAAKLVRPLVKQ